MRRRIAGLDCQCRSEHLPGRLETGWLEPIDRGYGAQDEVIRGWLAQPARDEALSLTEQQFGIDLGCRLGSDLALQRQDVVHLTIEPASPDHLAASANIEQADDDANAVAGALQRAVEQKIQIEALPWVAAGLRQTAIARRQRAIDAGDPAESRQGSSDLLGKSKRQGFQLVAVQDARRAERQRRMPRVSSRARKSPVAPRRTYGMLPASSSVATEGARPASARVAVHRSIRQPAPRRDRPGPCGRGSMPAMHPRESGSMNSNRSAATIVALVSYCSANTPSATERACRVRRWCSSSSQ